METFCKIAIVLVSNFFHLVSLYFVSGQHDGGSQAGDIFLLRSLIHVTFYGFWMLGANICKGNGPKKSNYQSLQDEDDRSVQGNQTF